MEPNKPCPLAIGVPTIGLRSETFINLHATRTLPGRTAVFGENWAENAHWKPEGPSKVLYAGNTKYERKVRHGLERLGLTSAPALIDFLKANEVEVVVAEYLHSFLPYLKAVKKAGIRWVSFGHGYDVSAIWRDAKWRERLMVLNEADGIVARAYSIRDRLASFGLNRDLIQVVYGSGPVPNEFTVRSESDAVELLCVGRMVAKKAPLVTLKAFAIARQSVPNLKLTYIGEGPLLEEARSFAASLPEDSVRLPGGQPFDTVLAAMRRCDVYLQHSMVDPVTGDEEGVPTVIFEAMGFGMPVVSTRHAGIPEVVRTGLDGFIGEEGDAEAMAESIVKLARDQSLRAKMGRSAYERARDNFDFKHEGAALRKVAGLSRFDSEVLN